MKPALLISRGLLTVASLLTACSGPVAIASFLFTNKGFHGHLMTAEYRIRGWALMLNFRPYCPRSKPSVSFQRVLDCTIEIGF